MLRQPWQPFNHAYIWLNTSDNLIIANPSISAQNTYIGGATQQATSVVTNTNELCYELVDDCFSVYGFQVCSPFSSSLASLTRLPGVKYEPGKLHCVLTPA